MIKQGLAAFLAVGLLAACNADGDQPRTAGDDSARAEAPAPPRDHEPDRARPAAAADGAWRARVESAVAALEESDPALYQELARLEPRTTRAGHLRFTTSAIHDARAAAVFLDRLARGGEPARVRRALVEALPRTGGPYADALSDLLEAEPAPVVRAVLVDAARRAPGDRALPVIGRGLGDRSPLVRAEAARAAAGHAQGEELADALVTALADTDASVRAAAVRALGVKRIDSARRELASRLDDRASDVRLASLHALERIDPDWLAGRPELAELRADADPRVSRLAAKIQRTATPR